MLSLPLLLLKPYRVDTPGFREVIEERGTPHLWVDHELEVAQLALVVLERERRDFRLHR